MAAATIMLAVLPLSEWRVRALFDGDAPAEAGDPAYWSIGSLDNVGAAPKVREVVVAPGALNAAELVLDAPLATGGRYTLTFAGVP